MKIRFFAIILLTMLGYTSLAQNIITLSDWKFKQAGSSKWYDARVPGYVHLDLHKNGLIKDPFYRLNEKDLQWIDKVNWEYKVNFKIDKALTESDKLYLIIKGLDTYADVYLNNHLIHVNTNMFISNRLLVDESILSDTNELRIYFRSPTIEGLKKLEAYGFPLPADNDQSENGGLGPNKVSIFTRKAPYHFGWDWGPRLVSSGIWRDIYFEVTSEPLINELYIRQRNISEKVAELYAEFEVSDYNENNLEISVFINNKIFLENQNIKPFLLSKEKVTNVPTDDELLNNPQFSIPIKINNPLLWWPNGHGDQNLYSFKIELRRDGKIVCTKQVTTGLRDIQLVRKPDEFGESFYFSVNGKPIFAKGANYIPMEVFPADALQAKYNDLILSAVNSNINMLRVWGGGIYENDIFYELCDKYGIMVWQDFMFACAMYPATNEFLKEVSIEVSQNIKRLRNFACIALWCGNNEIEQAWGPYEEKRGWGWKQRYDGKQREIIWNAYDTIFHHLIPDLIRINNPETDYWPSSPSAGVGKLAGHDNKSGDMHYWGVWHGNESIEMFEHYKARFMSEYGFQSFPEYETIKKYTSEDDWSFDSPVMLSHQRSSIGNQRILSYMKESYKTPSNFEDQIYVGQLVQAEAIKKAIKSHRSEMPYCMGSLYWQLNDCWPVASWSGIDYYGRWKAMQYFIRDAFKNQIIAISIKDENLIITGISDSEQFDASLRVNLLDFSGKSLWNRSYSVKMPSNNARRLITLPLDKLPAIQNKTNAVLFVTLVKNEKVICSDLFYLDKPKNLKLPDPNLNIHIRDKSGIYELEISSKNLCKNLMLISEGNEFSFSDNYFDILPGETKIIRVKSNLSYEDFEKKLSYIHLQLVE